MRAILRFGSACMPFRDAVFAVLRSQRSQEGETCDGIAAIKCDKGLWCEHPAGQCQVIDGAGTCVERRHRTAM